MAFTGRYELVRRENHKKNMDGEGIPIESHEAPSVTEVVQDGDDFTWTKTLGSKVSTNKFTLNQECELETIGGTRFKGTAYMIGGKIVVQFPKVLFTAELNGDKLIEYYTSPGEDGETMKAILKRI